MRPRFPVDGTRGFCCRREEAEQAAAQNRELKTMVQTLERRAKQLEKGMQLKDLSIAELDLKLQVRLCATKNATFLSLFLSIGWCNVFDN